MCYHNTPCPNCGYTAPIGAQEHTRQQRNVAQVVAHLVWDQGAASSSLAVPTM